MIAATHAAGRPDLETLARDRDWPTFFALLRDSQKQVSADLSTLHLAYRLASQRDPSEDVGPAFRTINVALLRNATLEPWLPSAFGALVARGLVPRFWLGDYGVYESYFLGEVAPPAKFIPDVTLVFMDPEELAGDHGLTASEELREAMQGRLNRLADMIATRSEGAVVVANLPPPPHGASSVYMSQVPSSWSSVRRRLNLRLIERFADHASVHILDVADAASRFGARRARDDRTYYASGVPFSTEFMPILARAFAEVVRPIFWPARKCVVVDCDNTLWGGILGEDGPSGLKLGGGYPGNLYRRFQLYLKSLLDQGILVALNSKNNERDVLDFLASSEDMVLRREQFAAYRINWRDKAANLQELASEMNIGLDAILSIDDSEVECALIRSVLPEVRVELFPSNPLDIPAFIDGLTGLEVLRVTAEDRERTESIRSNVHRERLRRAATDLDEFIRSLDIRLTIRFRPDDLVARISQLTQRTNQFNLTTRRYTPDEIQELMAEGLVYTLGMSDRFSDYGTVGAAVVKGRDDEAEFDTLLLSCRAFGREVEHAFVRVILQDLASRRYSAVTGRYIETAKNAMVRDFFERCGFTRLTPDEQGERFRLQLSDEHVTRNDARYTIETGGVT